MLFTLLSRDGLLRLLPKGGVVAEIGVAEGVFSKTILENTEPEHLHLIDPWQFQENEKYQGDPNNVSDAQNEARFGSVVEKFAEEEAAGRVTIHRSLSGDAVSTFEDGYFDWIYLDGSHAYRDVSEDLDHYDAKIKADGFILGHDYTNHIEAKKMNFGVVEAVNEFVNTRGYEFLILTNEEFPTFVLAKSIGCKNTQSLIANLVMNVRGTIEIEDFPRRGFKHKEVMRGETIVNLIPTF